MQKQKLTPREFWLLVKARADASLAEINSHAFRGDCSLEWHLLEVASLSSLLKEQDEVPPLTCHDTV